MLTKLFRRKYLYAIISGFLIIQSAFGATFDAASSQIGTGVSSMTWSHTCTGGNRMLIVGVVCNSAQSISSVTYNGVAMSSSGSSSANGVRKVFYYRMAPATGANNIVVTASASTTMVGVAASYTGINQTGGGWSVTGSSGTTASDVVGSAAGNIVIDFIGSNDQAPSVGAGQTQRVSRNNTYYAAISDEPGAASVTMSWSFGVSDDFSHFYKSNAALPIDLLYFSADPDFDCKKDRVNIQWTTATEWNNDYFTIEKNTDGYSYASIGTVQGAGNSNTTRHYEFLDYLSEALNPDQTFYRLKQTDYDGRFEYFGPVSVSDCRQGISISPTLTDDWVMIRSLQEQARSIFTVSDPLGRNIIHEVLPDDWTEKALDLSGYAGGIYLLSIYQPGQVTMKKIVLQ